MKTEINNITLIFTDESGAWNNKANKFYVRSWIKISVLDLIKLAKTNKKNPHKNILEMANEEKIGFAKVQP